MWNLSYRNLPFETKMQILNTCVSEPKNWCMAQSNYRPLKKSSLTRKQCPHFYEFHCPQMGHFAVFSCTGRYQSSLCDTLMSVCPVGRLSVCKQFLLPHLLWGFLSQRLLYSPSLLALWCSCAPAILIMILSPEAPKGGVAIFTI